MWLKHTMVMLFTLVLACTFMMGCAQTRIVMTPQSQDMLQGAPEWAQSNGKIEGVEDKIFFVGVSEEQVTGEAEAVDQAYKDAMRRISDYIGVRISARNPYAGTFTTGTDTRWPHRLSPHLANKVVGLAAPGGYALSNGADWSGIGATAIAPIWLAKPEYKGNKGARYANNRGAELAVCNWVGGATIEDTWVVAERFFSGVNAKGPFGGNNMRYAQLWKAKVLVSVSKADIDEVREELNDRQQQELETDFELRKAEALMFFDKPTFHFMNNTSWYGMNGPRRFEVKQVRMLPNP